MCRHCGGAALTQVGVESDDHHELVAKPVLVTRVNLGVGACACCGRRTTAEPPAGMEGLVGGRLRAFTVLLRHYSDVPYTRLRTMLDEVFRLRLSQGYLVSMIDDAAVDMVPAVADIRASIRAAPVVMSDETGRGSMAGTAGPGCSAPPGTSCSSSTVAPRRWSRS